MHFTKSMSAFLTFQTKKGHTTFAECPLFNKIVLRINDVILIL